MAGNPPRAWPGLLLFAALTGLGACAEDGDGPPVSSAASSAQRAPSAASAGYPAEPGPRLLYLPDGGDRAPPSRGAPELVFPQPGMWPTTTRCPAEMVDVRGQFCIDRWEAQLVDDISGQLLSPYYAPDSRKTRRERDVWAKRRLEVGSDSARSVGLPEPPAFQLSGQVSPRAVSKPGVLPHGYLTGEDAVRACESAGKRLCKEAEWVQACRGEANLEFPYGESYVQGTCNVFREGHPAMELHDNPSTGHLDPRLNQVRINGKPLLRRTGATPACASRWGNDAIYDMVGNLDEWVDDPDGVFLGGFYSRATKRGCAQRVSAHPFNYYDYSLGVRCCKNP